MSDAQAIAAVHIASSDDAYAPLAATWRSADLPTRTAQWTKTLADSAGELVLVAHEADRIVGFVGGGAARRQEPGAPMEIYVIHVHPACRGGGVGQALWFAACDTLRGADRAALYVDTLAELRCCSFYERLGGRVIERRPIDFQGAMRTHVTYEWPEGHEADHLPQAGYFPKTT